jgi:serine phosphatase RsbU (regulator of sigma subunit)/anti-sigma regulatory factor (Ser/Thr protein kinase)
VPAADAVALGVAAAAVAGAGGFLLGRRASRNPAEGDALAQMSTLQQITGALAAASTTKDVVSVVVRDVRRAIGADAASLSEVDGDHVRILGAQGYSDEVVTAWSDFTVDGDTAFRDAVLERRLVFAENRSEMAARWPELLDLMPTTRQSVAALPLVVDGQARGLVGFGFDSPRRFTLDDQAFLLAVGAQCAEALVRARLRETSQIATHRIAFLSEASDAFASSLDLDGTLKRVAELAVPRLADIAGVFVVRDGAVAAIEIAHANPDRAEHLRQVAERWQPDLEQSVGIGAVARTGEPLFYTGITDEQIRAGGRDPEHADALASLALDSFVAVPMRVRERIVGLIFLGTERPRRLSPEDFTLATELASRAGQAILNAELFEERSRIAGTLQASLRPPETPVIAGLELATRFFAVGEGIDVGGDFYDVFPLGAGGEPPERWVVVIGDVRGKGVEAASTSGAARHAIRTAALRETSPAAMLRRLNSLLLGLSESNELEPRFCTAVVVVITPGDASASVVLCAGGHPPPFIQRANGTITSVESTGTLIGVLEDPEVSDSTFELGSGDALVLYTDGVTERHAGDRFFDEEGLASVLTRCIGFTAPVLAERIETASRAFVEDAPRDDLAIVVIRVPEGVASTSATSTDLPPDLTAPGLARRFVVAAIDALDAKVSPDTAALLASELVTNSVLHATGPLRVAVESSDGRLRVTVHDGSVVAPRVLDPEPDATSGRGMQLVDRLSGQWGIDTVVSGKSVWFELVE